jgi:hypothetical protein
MLLDVIEPKNYVKYGSHTLGPASRKNILSTQARSKENISKGMIVYRMIRKEGIKEED